MARKTLHTNAMDPNDEFEAMYKSNQPLIYRFMFWRTRDEMLAEDLTSNVFEKAWGARASFKGGSAKAWLHKIARNTLIDHWRKQQDFAVTDSAELEIVTEESNWDEALDQEAAVESLRRAVSKLPKDMRCVVELRFILGLSARQTGQQLKISEANVRVIQYRALQKLRNYLDEQ